MRVFVTVIFFCCWCRVAAQDYSYAHYVPRDGLAGFTVYSLCQDKDGFMWFGTESGVSRFDGTSFKNFTTDDGLPDNEILELFADDGGRVWFAPFKHSVCYYYKGRIHNQENDSVLRKLPITGRIFSIAEDLSHNIYLGELDKVFKITPSGKVFVIPFLSDKPSAFTLLQRGSGNSITLLNSYDAFKLEGDKIIRTDSLISHYKLLLITQVGLGDNQILWLRKKDSLFCRNLRGDSSFYLKPSAGPTIMSFAKRGVLALNSSTGTTLYDLQKRRPIGTFLENKNVSRTLFDSEGNTWFCTFDEGVFRLSSTQFRKLQLPPQANIANITCIEPFADHLLAGNNSATLIEINNASQKNKLMALKGAGGPIRKTVVIRKIDNEYYFAGFDEKTALMKGDRIIADKAAIGAIKSIYVASRDSVLLATSVGAFRVSLDNWGQLDTLYRERVQYIYNAGDAIYFATLQGVFRKVGQQPPISLGERFPVLRKRVIAIDKDNSGTLWFATTDAGVVGYRDNRIVAHYTDANGLSSNISRCLYAGGNELWLGTDKGLNKIDLVKHSPIRHYTTSDGLVSDIINAVAADDSMVYVGTPLGLTYFNEKLIQQQSICELRWTGIYSGNISVAPDSAITVSYKQNNISFNYVAISFKSAGDIIYHYRLAGLEEEWKTTTGQQLNFLSLPAGSYTLQLYGVNKFGKRSGTQTINFIVTTPYWQTWWFRLLAVLALLAILSLFVNYRVKIIRQQEKEKSRIRQQMAELEQMALRSQMNPHFIFNCLNSLQQFVLEKDVNAANHFLTGFASLIRQTFDNSSRQFITVANELKYLDTYLKLEQSRFGGSFGYVFCIDPDIDRDITELPVMILQPYVENSVRHGLRHLRNRRGKITLSMEVDKDFLICTVEDNGVGRKEASRFRNFQHIEYQSRGMLLTKQRIENINAVRQQKIILEVTDITDAAGEPGGTRVVIGFPI